MAISFLFDYPVWLIAVCLTIGLLISGLLYYKNQRDGLNNHTARVLAVFRFIVVSLICILLLGPLVERQTQYVEEPILVFMQDNSSSLLLFEDSAWYREDYTDQIRRFIESVSPAFETRLYAFGESVTADPELSFTDRETNMAAIFTELEIRYSNRNLAAIIVAGDGLFNRGINPLYASAATNIPVYTIALGDTVPRRDLVLTDVGHNRISYLGNRFPVEIDIEAFQSRGLSSKLLVSRDEEVLYEQEVFFDSDHHTETISLILEADKPGMQRYKAEILAVEDEVSLRNNYREFFVDIIDRRQQVLILANAPHPDVAAIKLSLEQGGQYEIDVSLIRDFQGSFAAYDVVVLHQLPSAHERSADLIEKISEANTGVLFITGRQTDLDIFNQLGRGIVIDLRSDDFTETYASYNHSFALFSLREDIVSALMQMPPLYSPFASYTMPSSASVLLFQRIGNVVTSYPLIGFGSDLQGRTGIIAGEGIWRWRLQTYYRHGSHEAFDVLMSRIVQFLSIQEDRSLFRVRTENLIMENEPFIVEAELYNRSYELVNEPDVNLTIYDGDGAEYQFYMGKTTNAYRLDAGSFPTGVYSWRAEVTLGNEVFSEEGVVNISSLDLETLTTMADHQLLYQLAQASGGKMYYPGQWDLLSDELLSRDDFRPRLYNQKEYTELINIRWLFFLMLMLLSAEWLIRKRSGGY